MDIDIGGVRGVYEEVGTGQPLVLIASPLARAKTYRTTAAALARTFRVLTVELPGSGRADGVGAGWPVERYAAWVAGFVGELRLSRPVVVGHSHSGSIGVVLAARHPDAVGRLVVADATGTGPHSVLRTFTGALFDVVLELDVVLTRWHHVVGNLFTHPRNFVRQARDALTVDVRADAGRVSAPTLVAWGAREHTLPPRHAAEFARVLPNARVYLSRGGGHTWLIRRPDEFAAVVSEFATTTPAERSGRRAVGMEAAAIPHSPSGSGRSRP